MRSISLVLLFFALIFGNSHAVAEVGGPRETAAHAFSLQMQEEYLELLQLYDPVAVGEIAELFRGALGRSDGFDAERQAFLVQVFGSDDREKLMRLPATEVLARLFSFLFTSQLSDEEREFLKAARFQFEGLEQSDGDITTVLYVIDFAAAGGGQSKLKRMNLKQHETSWVIQVDPGIAVALKQLIGALSAP